MIEPLGLLLDRGDQFLARLLVVERREPAQRRRRAENGCKRGLEIVRDGADHRLAQLLGPGGHARLLDRSRQQRALDRDRRLVEQRGVEFVVGDRRRRERLAVHCEAPYRSARGGQPQQVPAAGRHRRRACSAAPELFRARDVVGRKQPVVQPVGHDRQPPAGRHEQHDLAAECAAQMVDDREVDLVHLGDPHESLAEAVQRRDVRLAAHRARGLPADLRGEIAGEDRHDDEDDEVDQVARVVDAEIEDRRIKEKALDRHRRHRRGERGAEAPERGAGEHRRQEQQRHLRVAHDQHGQIGHDAGQYRQADAERIVEPRGAPMQRGPRE